MSVKRNGIQQEFVIVNINKYANNLNYFGNVLYILDIHVFIGKYVKIFLELAPCF